ncbi:O-methyltransferase [Bacteroidota bacterium]
MKAINSLNRIISYFIHLLKAQSNFSIHSPFVFEFVTKVIRNDRILQEYAKIELLREQLLCNQQFINISDFGTGAEKKRKRKISDIARTSLKSNKQARLIHRITQYFNPENILELGTSFGLTTFYIALAVPQSKIISIEGCNEIASIANTHFKSNDLHNIELITGNIDLILTQNLNKMNRLDMVFFDANHTHEATIEYFLMTSAMAHNDTIFIFDDIHWSSGMELAWKQIKALKEVTLSIDLYHMGIVFFKKELSKQDFIIRF